MDSELSGFDFSNISELSLLKKETIDSIEISFHNHTIVCKYTGDINDDGKPDGKGIAEGSYSDDKLSFSFSYDGDFTDGSISGNGVSTQKEKDGRTITFDGVFDNGRWNGEGTETIRYESGDIDYDTFAGVFKNELMISGTQTTNYVNGNVAYYEGEWNDNKWNGYGKKTVTYKSGKISKSVFSCNYKDGNVVSGSQTDYYSNGDTSVYTGEWADNTLNGKGKTTITYKTGDIDKIIYEGIFKSGEWVSSTMTTINKNGESSTETYR